MHAKDWKFQKFCYVCKIAKMKIASGGKMSELITGVFKGEKQFSTIMSALANLLLLLQFSWFYYVLLVAFYKQEII